MYSWSRPQNAKPSRPPNKKCPMAWFKFLVKKVCPPKYEWIDNTYSSFFINIDYPGHPIIQLRSMLVTRKLSQISRYRTLCRSIHLVTDYTTLLKLTLKLSAFSCTCEHYMAMQAVGQVTFRPHRFSAERTCTQALWINTVVHIELLI